MSTENKKILLVEDDRNFGDVLRSYLEMHGYDVTLATDGEMGLETYNSGSYDVGIFDVMMPKKDGFSLAKDIRDAGGTIPIIFLTAKTMKEDVLKGFKLGADDYISKPFNSEELLYRIKAIIKRSLQKAGPKQDIKEFNIGIYHFNIPVRILTNTLTKQKDKLSPKEAELLRMFCTKMNEVLPRSEALKEIWGQDDYFTARSMDVFVTKLRKYLKGDENIEIVNIHGSGFQLLVKGMEKNDEA
ncbi:MAG TPA: response regulator transcription factor [Phaeodactylibacter sp.]|nr:response regulator transcription factor [Phaeodactylibacter sp.]